MRNRRGDLSNGDKHQDDSEVFYDRSVSSRDDHNKDGKKKCKNGRDEKYRDKEEMDWENKHRSDKHQDKHSAKDHTSKSSGHKHAKEGKDDADSRRKRTKHLENDQNRNQNVDRNCHRDASHASEHSARRKENRAKKRNLEERDDCDKSRLRVHKIHCSDAKRSSNALDSNADKGGSQQPHGQDDLIGTSSKPRNENVEDLTFKESITDMELKTKGLKDELSDMSDIGPGNKITGKPSEIDYDLSYERSSRSKIDLVERSPSSTSIEHDYVNRSSVRKNLGNEESGPRKSIDAGGFSTSEDRLSQGLKPEKQLLNKISQADLSLFGRTNHGSASLIPPPPSLGAWHGTYSWRSVPNQTLLIPNGFATFQHEPTHGGFQGMTPLFPTQPLFGVRPPVGVNHVCIPYHIPYVDWFSGDMLPLGWQNMMGGTFASHFHGWDGNNGVLRDNSHAYGSSDWNTNRHLLNHNILDSGPETSMGHNGHLKRDSTPPACEDAPVPLQVGGVSTEPASHMSQDYCKWDHVPVKIPRTKLCSSECSGKVMSCSPTTMPEKALGMLASSNNTSFLSQTYLSKLDISTELTHPELYDQCMRLLDIGKSASIDSDVSTGFLKNGSRSRKKFIATLSTIPADSSVYQKAMEHYKKQIAELPKWGEVDVKLETNRKLLDEPVSASDLVHMLVAVATDDALTNMPISTLHLNKEELPPPAKEHLKELHQNLCQMGQVHVCAHPIKPESLIDGVYKGDDFASEWKITGNVIVDFKLESHTSFDVVSSKDVVTAKEELGSGDTLSSPYKEDEFSSELVITDDVDGKQNTVVITEPKFESDMHTSSGVVSSKDVVTDFAHYAEEEMDSEHNTNVITDSKFESEMHASSDVVSIKDYVEEEMGSDDTLSCPYKEDEFTSEWVITGDVDEKHNIVAITEPKLESEMHTSSDVVSSKDVITGFAPNVEEELSSGDTLSVPCKEDEFTCEWMNTGDVDGKHNTVVITEPKLESEMHTIFDVVNSKDVFTGFAHSAEELGLGDTLRCPYKEDEFTCECVNTGDVDGKPNTIVITESELESKMHPSSDAVNGKDIITGFAHSAEEKLGLDDTLRRPLICESDTPGASDGLVSGSKESKPPI